MKVLTKVSKVNVTSARNKDIRHMNVDPRSFLHTSLIGIATIVRSLGIEKMNVDPSQTRHLNNLTSQEMHLSKVTLMIGITIIGIVVTIIRNMDMFLRIT